MPQGPSTNYGQFDPLKRITEGYENALANAREREQNLLQQVAQLQEIIKLLREKVDILQKHFDANP